MGPVLFMAESEGFEPSIGVNRYTLSRGAPSATRPALQNLFTAFYLVSRAIIPGVPVARYSLATLAHPCGVIVVASDALRSYAARQPLGQLSKTYLLRSI